MDRITITLPSEMKGYVDAEVAGGSYGNTSEYIRDLIRHDRERKAMLRVESLVRQGIESGPSEPWTSKDVDDIRAAVRKQAKKRRGGK